MADNVRTLWDAHVGSQVVRKEELIHQCRKSGEEIRLGVLARVQPNIVAPGER
jgi:hypothetical protein